MKSISFHYDAVFVGRSRKRGRGIFTNASLTKGQVLEIAPVLVLSREDRKLIDKTMLHNYIFEWGDDRKECCMALGFVPLYNHAYQSNCEYEMDFKKQLITIRTVRAINAGEELFINYNGEWNNETTVWFETA